MRALISPEGLHRLDEAIDYHILYPAEYRPGQWIAQLPGGPVLACTAGRVVLQADASPMWTALEDCSCSESCAELNGAQVARNVMFRGHSHHVQCLAAELLGIDGTIAVDLFAGFNQLPDVIGFRNTLAHSIGQPPMRLPVGMSAEHAGPGVIAVFASPDLVDYMLA